MSVHQRLAMFVGLMLLIVAAGLLLVLPNDRCGIPLFNLGERAPESDNLWLGDGGTVCGDQAGTRLAALGVLALMDVVATGAGVLLLLRRRPADRERTDAAR